MGARCAAGGGSGTGQAILRKPGLGWVMEGLFEGLTGVSVEGSKQQSLPAVSHAHVRNRTQVCDSRCVSDPADQCSGTALFGE